MEPGPPLASPPETDHVTAAASPFGSLAENCSTDAPLEFVVLQPVQLVSMEPVPGAIEKLPLDGAAVTPPPAQPATAKRTAGNRSARSLGDEAKSPRERMHESRRFRQGKGAVAASWGLCGKIVRSP